MSKPLPALLLGATPTFAAPMKVGIVGLVHDHLGSFLGGGALASAGSVLSRPLHHSRAHLPPC